VQPQQAAAATPKGEALTEAKQICLRPWKMVVFHSGLSGNFGRFKNGVLIVV